MSQQPGDGRLVVDTSAYYATAVRRDSNYAMASTVMERLGIRTAFALDRHFAQFGWETVPHEGAQADRQ